MAAVSGPPVRSATPVHRIGDKPGGSGPRYPDFVIIAGPRLELGPIERACKAAGFSALVVGDGHVPVTPDMVKALHLEGRLGPTTEVVLHMHGGVVDGKHRVVLTDVPTSTRLLISTLRRHDESTWSGRLHLASCHAGEFRKELHPDDPLWEAGECLVYSSTKRAFATDAVVEMFRFQGEWQKKDGKRPTSFDLTGHIADSCCECVSLVGHGLDAPLVLHAPRTVAEMENGWRESFVQQKLQAQLDRSRVVGAKKDLARLSALGAAEDLSPGARLQRFMFLLKTRVMRDSVGPVAEVLRLRNAYGVTAQHLDRLLSAAFAWEIDVEMVHCLIEAGANLKNAMFHWVSSLNANNNSVTVAAVLKAHPDLLEAIDDNGNTLLHCAVSARADVRVNLLLALGANVNQVDALGRSPLHLVRYSVVIAEMLIGNQADVNVLDSANRTPLDEAGFLVAQLLRDHGARHFFELASPVEIVSDLSPGTPPAEFADAFELLPGTPPAEFADSGDDESVEGPRDESCRSQGGFADAT